MRIKDFSNQFGVSVVELVAALKERKAGSYNEDSVLSDEQLGFLRKRFNQYESAKPFTHGLSAQEKITVQDMTVGELANRLKCPVSGLILQLLKRGIFANKNQIVKKEQIIALLQDLGVAFEEVKNDSEDVLEKFIEAKSSSGAERRLPTVAVVGHVDHGKTTLLDFIRKARVAEGEKGGITQHVAAYEVVSKHGNLVFLDTPGHEAFSLMRERGVLIADLVVLVVALDDGVKPQTIESIKAIKSFGATTVVALNKIDKVSPDKIDIVKRQLTDHGLLPDDWGGETPYVAISGKTGQGVDELLEVIRLQADILDLKTSSTDTARGFVLESRMEHGRGAVATVILQRGTICRGNHFVCGSTYGKVSSMKNYLGKNMECAGPSVPAQIAGFSALPLPGDVFEFAFDAGAVKKHKNIQIKPIADTTKGGQDKTEGEGGINVILKASTILSKEALVASIAKLNQQQPEKIKIIDVGVGDINESNIELALTTGSIIYGLGVKVNKTAHTAVKKDVVIKTFDIIYKLLEDAKETVLKSHVKKVEEKIQGVARVKAIFKIKSVGIVAGAAVESGQLLQGGKVKIYRDKELVGHGIIKTLQKDRNKVTSVSEGSDCAFAVDGFTSWKNGDVVHHIIEIIS
ncbi:MAG TPA: translation initiation factor IF-2 [Candidatus Saccharimonadales bacterium]|nr:translation initiation factor IF-2 [Candidatus Saccharimonadales bacterium]